MKKLIVWIMLLCAYPNDGMAQITDNTAQAIAQKIWQSLGRTDRCPSVYFKEDDAMATYSYEDHKIRLSQKEVNERFLSKFNQNATAALAIVIGHEIFHAITGEKSRQHFGDWGHDNASKEAELNADLHGLLWAYFIGYEHSIAVFDGIFPTGNKGGFRYPERKERQESDSILIERAKTYIHIFETGNLLLVSAKSQDDYDDARQCYQYFQSETQVFTQDVEYNIGLSWFLQALELRKAESFVFPLEFSGFSALKRLGGIKYSAEEAEVMIDSATYHFNKANNIVKVLQGEDIEDSFNARMGLCCAAILKNIDAALIQIEKLEKESPQRLESKLLRAIALAFRNQGDDHIKSGAILTTLSNNPNATASIRQQAQFNLVVLNGGVSDADGRAAADCSPLLNGAKTLSDVITSLGDRSNGIIVQDNNVLNIKILENHSTVYFFEEWTGREGINNSQRAFQRFDHCECSMDKIANWIGRSIKYRYFPEKNGKYGWILSHDEGNKGDFVCYRVFRP